MDHTEITSFITIAVLEESAQDLSPKPRRAGGVCQALYSDRSSLPELYHSYSPAHRPWPKAYGLWPLAFGIDHRHEGPTLVYLSPSVTFRLMSGTIPKRCASISSGTGDVFCVNRTWSIAGLSASIPLLGGGWDIGRCRDDEGDTSS